jgi:hypothetical protein
MILCSFNIFYYLLISLVFNYFSLVIICNLLKIIITHNFNCYGLCNRQISYSSYAVFLLNLILKLI